jgi:hypothetical protein
MDPVVFFSFFSAAAAVSSRSFMYCAKSHGSQRETGWAKLPGVKERIQYCQRENTFPELFACIWNSSYGPLLNLVLHSNCLSPLSKMDRPTAKGRLFLLHGWRKSFSRSTRRTLLWPFTCPLKQMGARPG